MRTVPNQTVVGPNLRKRTTPALGATVWRSNTVRTVLELFIDSNCTSLWSYQRIFIPVICLLVHTVRDERKLRRRNYPSQLQRRGAKHHIEKV